VRERAGHTLQPTALVHEAYLKLIDSTVIGSGDRNRFLALAARAMRQVLIDFARQRKAGRRGGGDWERVTLHPELVGEASSEEVDLLDLDEALARLAEVHDVAARVVELRYFGGLTLVEAGALLGISDSMVSKYWRTAQAWLRRELGSAGSP
jgi:RNA polymerase sigma-70 factor (ECF subfamily)